MQGLATMLGFVLGLAIIFIAIHPDRKRKDRP